MKNYISLVILTIALLACNEKSPDCGDPTSMNCELILVDKNDNLLVGSCYSESQIELKKGNELIPLIFDNGIIIFNYYNLKPYNRMDIKLKLNEIDLDTINLSITTLKTECWTIERLDSFKYNGEIIDRLTGNKYKIIK